MVLHKKKEQNNVKRQQKFDARLQIVSYLYLSWIQNNKQTVAGSISLLPFSNTVKPLYQTAICNTTHIRFTSQLQVRLSFLFSTDGEMEKSMLRTKGGRYTRAKQI